MNDTILTTRYGSANAVTRIRFAVKSGSIALRTVTLKDGQRLDHLAAKHLGDGSLWWIIAAVSNIGWGMQVPPGTIIKIPAQPQRVLELI